LKSTDYGRTRHSKNRQTVIKALAEFAEDCLSLRSKRVPQALQVPAYLIHLPFIFCWSEGFFWLSRQLVPSDSEGNNCASEATQILRLNNEQNLRYLNIFAPQKVT